jgi:hypothetical protein
MSEAGVVSLQRRRRSRAEAERIRQSNRICSAG